MEVILLGILVVALLVGTKEESQALGQHLQGRHEEAEKHSNTGDVLLLVVLLIFGLGLAGGLGGLSLATLGDNMNYIITGVR